MLLLPFPAVYCLLTVLGMGGRDEFQKERSRHERVAGCVMSFSTVDVIMTPVLLKAKLVFSRSLSFVSSPIKRATSSPPLICFSHIFTLLVSFLHHPSFLVFFTGTHKLRHAQSLLSPAPPPPSSSLFLRNVGQHDSSCCSQKGDRIPIDRSQSGGGRWLGWGWTQSECVAVAI